MTDHLIQAKIQGIAQWSGALGVTLPKGLADALAVREYVSDTFAAPPLDYPDAGDITPKNVAEHVERLTVAKSQEQARLDVMRVIRERIDGRVIREAGQAAPAIRDQLAPRVAELAETYADAARQLPSGITQDVLTSNVDLMQAYATAVKAAAGMAPALEWAQGLVFNHRNKTFAVALPATPEDVAALDEASHDRSDPTRRQLNPVLLVAAHRDLPIGLHLSAEIDEALRAVAAERQRRFDAQVEQIPPAERRWLRP